jgi:N-acetylglucosamine-6-phosphate deacetylase
MKKDKLILITDAMRAGCMKCGTYDLGGRKVEVVNSKALLDDGTLAGSVLKMNEALHNMTSHTSMTLVEAVNSVTKVPAQKLDVKKGEIRVGFDADIVMFDEAFNVLLSVVGGEIKYQC